MDFSKREETLMTRSILLLCGKIVHCSHLLSSTNIMTKPTVDIAPIEVIDITNAAETLEASEPEVSCTTCQACCCRLEVFIFTDTGVPQKHIAYDKWGSETMNRLYDGWCSALDRETYMCTIYENRPLVCREFDMGSYECRTERKEQMV